MNDYVWNMSMLVVFKCCGNIHTFNFDWPQAVIDLNTIVTLSQWIVLSLGFLLRALSSVCPISAGTSITGMFPGVQVTGTVLHCCLV